MAKKAVGFKDLDEKLDRVIDAMVTKEDVHHLEEKLSQRMTAIEETQQRIFLILDRLATTIEKLNIEYVSIKVQLERHERWFKQVSERTGIKLEDQS